MTHSRIVYWGIPGVPIKAEFIQIQYHACVQGSTNGTNGIPISFMVLPMVPLVFAIGTNGNANGTIASPNGTVGTIGTNGNANGTIASPNGTVGTIGKPMVPLVKLPMVPLGEPRIEPIRCSNNTPQIQRHHFQTLSKFYMRGQKPLLTPTQVRESIRLHFKVIGPRSGVKQSQRMKG